MHKRFVCIWFKHLTTDWFARRHPALKEIPFVLSASSRGRLIITAANSLAASRGIYEGMAVADARAILPTLKVLDNKPQLSDKLLTRLAEWFIRFTPYVSIDPLGGLILDVTGCCHLWGGEGPYLTDMIKRLKLRGYTISAAMADTIGAAWAIARYGKETFVIPKGGQIEALVHLPPEALRLEIDIIERLHKLGLRQIKDFISIPAYSLSRRFGPRLLQRLHQAVGIEEEFIQPIYPVKSYEERLTCPEPIVTRTGIEIALRQLLHTLCEKLQKEGKGLRALIFSCHRVDGEIILMDITTNHPTYDVAHLFKLFELKLSSLQPAEGIETFVLQAKEIEKHAPVQEKMWKQKSGEEDQSLSHLLDRLTVKIGADNISRYEPEEHYIPERSIKRSKLLGEPLNLSWRTEGQRPLHLLNPPEHIEVTAPVPDYPPMLFRYKEKLHKIIKADGPERIEQEWWIGNGKLRDYYYVEDEEGHRYWLFRSGHYSADKTSKWFIHGFFA